MKASKTFAISLAGLVAACAIPFGTVFAAAGGNTTEYPVKTEADGKTVMPFECELLFSDDRPITDYAVSGDTVAFASHTLMYVLYTGENGDRKLDDEHNYTGSNRIERLDFDGGNLYLDVKTDGIFLYPDYTNQATHVFPDLGNTVKLSGDEEYRLSNDGLHYFSGDDHEVLGTDFTNLKTFDDKAYAVKNNVLYRFDGINPVKVDVNYTDFEGAENISCGDVKEKLTAKNYEIYTADILSGNYYTKINADFIGGENDTFIPIHTEKAAVDKTCIVLCESGNATVVATNDGMYITATENLSEAVPSQQKNDWALGADGRRLAAYATENTYVYASPFMCRSTRIGELKSGAENSVEVIEKFEFGGVKFYRITFDAATEGGGTEKISGFVAANVLTEHDYKADDNVQHENGDKQFSYQTNVVTVVLAIVIVALVIVAIMYIALIGSKKDKNKDKKKNRKKKKEKDVQDETDEADDADETAPLPENPPVDGDGEE
ncbi:MAG: hypothetical protein NC131_02805 [Roseburia sp.]|nr:hypothetical protein [Roseburia sp.]